MLAIARWQQQIMRRLPRFYRSCCKNRGRSWSTSSRPRSPALLPSSLDCGFSLDAFFSRRQARMTGQCLSRKSWRLSRAYPPLLVRSSRQKNYWRSEGLELTHCAEAYYGLGRHIASLSESNVNSSIIVSSLIPASYLGSLSRLTDEHLQLLRLYTAPSSVTTSA